MGRRLLVLPALPAFRVLLSYTPVTTYLPLLAHRLCGPTVMGAVIGGEGRTGANPPPRRRVVGFPARPPWGRLPFVLAGAVLAVAGLLLMPVPAGSLAGIAALGASIPVLRRIGAGRGDTG